MSDPAARTKDNKSCGLELSWPPSKEDLERLYLEQHLSAAKIALIYRLDRKYPRMKTAEMTILYHLKRNGIARRSKTEHVEKVTEEMVDDWVRRYQAGESLKEIAGNTVSPATVFNRLHRRGIQLRDKIEAQMKAVTKHEKHQFSGDPQERAYLLGFANGDLGVSKHGRAIRAKTSTTHPAMVTLFRLLFEKYGHVNVHPRRSQWTGFEWSLQVDLDDTFEFLESKLSILPSSFVESKKQFYQFLAGFIDAEGTIYFHKKKSRIGPEIIVTNTNLSLLSSIKERLERDDFSVVLQQTEQPAVKSAKSPRYIWKIRIWRYHDVSHLLTKLPLLHSERVAKAEVVSLLPYKADSSTRRQVQLEWVRLAEKIREDRLGFLRDAEQEITRS